VEDNIDLNKRRIKQHSILTKVVFTFPKEPEPMNLSNWKSGIRQKIFEVKILNFDLLSLFLMDTSIPDVDDWKSDCP
jgi:hypothetical protein